jgi:Domain of unknown function (DUF2760)
MLSVGTRIVAAFRLLFTGKLPPEILSVLLEGQPGPARTGPVQTSSAQPVTAAPAPPPVLPLEDQGDRAVQLLALLQRDGRLVDFLREDLAAYSDAQVGAAARDVHERCRVALERYIQLEPVSSEDEGEASLVSATSDPSTTRIVGNVPGRGSARGVVRHRGWRVVRMDLPPLPPGHARQVVAPAEIEVE